MPCLYQTTQHYIAEDHKLDTTLQTSTFSCGLCVHYYVSHWKLCALFTSTITELYQLLFWNQRPSNAETNIRCPIYICSLCSTVILHICILILTLHYWRYFTSTVLTNAYTDNIHPHFGTQQTLKLEKWVLELSPKQYFIRTTSTMGVLNSLSSNIVGNFTLFVRLLTLSSTYSSATIVHTGRHKTSV